MHMTSAYSWLWMCDLESTALNHAFNSWISTLLFNPNWISALLIIRVITNQRTDILCLAFTTDSAMELSNSSKREITAAVNTAALLRVKAHKKLCLRQYWLTLIPHGSSVFLFTEETGALLKISEFFSANAHLVLHHYANIGYFISFMTQCLAEQKVVVFCSFVICCLQNLS